MQRAPSSESGPLLKPSPSSLMAVTAALPLLTPAERHALLTPAERSAYESFLASSSSSSSTLSSSTVTSIRDLTPSSNGATSHDQNWQVFNTSSFIQDRSGNHTALAKATKDLIALQPLPSEYVPHNSGRTIQLSSPTNTSGAKPPHARLNSSGTTNAQLGPSATTNGGVGSHHHRPIAPAPATGSKNAVALGNSSAKRLRRSPSPLPPLPPTVGTPDSPSTLSAVAGPSSSTSIISGSPSAASQGLSVKPTLLTPQQKKANHIQSEQKRRANIRKGYEALCDTIPALREAIRAEEEMNHGHANGLVGGVPKKRRSREESGEKTDGRAGPRSESVVLQKSMSPSSFKSHASDF